MQISAGGPGAEFTASDIATLASVGSATGGFRNGSTLVVDTTNATSSVTISSPITNTNSMGLKKIGFNADPLVLAAANSFSGPTTLESGFLTVANSDALQNSTYTNTGGTFAFASGVTSAQIGGLGGGINLDLMNASANPVSLTLGNTAGGSFSGQLVGSTPLVKTGSGNQTFSGFNTTSFTGTTTINGGAMIYAANDAIGSVDMSGTDKVITANAGGTAAASYGFGIDQSFLDRIVDSSAGVAAFASAGSNPLDFTNKPSLSLGATGAFTLTGTITPAGSTYRLGGGGGNLTVGIALDGAGKSVVLSTNGTDANSKVTMNQQHTYDGGTTLNSGTLIIGANSTPTSGTVTSGPVGTGTLTLNGGRINTVNATSGPVVAVTHEIGNPIVVNSMSTTKITAVGTTSAATRANLIFRGPVTGSGTISVDSENPNASVNTAQIDFAGSLSGFGGVVEYYAYDTTSGGTGGRTTGNLNFTKVPSAPDAAYGGLYVQDFSTNRFLLHGGTNYASNGASMRFGDDTTVGTTDFMVVKIGEVSGDGGLIITQSGTSATFNRQVVEVGHLNTSTTFAGGFRENGLMDLVKVGTGSLTLSGRNAHTGTTTVRNGSLVVARDAVNTNLSNRGDSFTNDGIYENIMLANGTTDTITYDAANIDADTGGPIEELQNGDRVAFGYGTAPGGISATTEYFVINATGSGTARSYQISLTPGGSPVDIGTTAATSFRVYEVTTLGSTYTPVELGDTGAAMGHLATAPTDSVSLLTGGAVSVERPINVNNVGAGSTLGGNTDNNSTFSGNITLSKDVKISQVATTSGNAVTFSGVISGTGFDVTKIGLGKAVLSGANTYTGDTVVQAGTLSITNPFLANAADVLLTSGAFLGPGLCGHRYDRLAVLQRRGTSCGNVGCNRVGCCS